MRTRVPANGQERRQTPHPSSQQPGGSVSGSTRRVGARGALWPGAMGTERSLDRTAGRRVVTAERREVVVRPPRRWSVRRRVVVVARLGVVLARARLVMLWARVRSSSA